MKKEELIRLFSGRVRRILERVDLDFSQVHEIRMRTGAPLQMICRGKEFFPDERGRASRAEKGAFITERDLRETMEYIGNYSLYAYEDEIRQGYLTIQGGHRVGIAGKAVIEDGKVRGISPISCINLRISHSVEGCADPVMPYLWEKEEFCHTLIVSPPRRGKTTLLGDVNRQTSAGAGGRRGLTVGVVDERSEIAGACRGVAQNRMGIRTDVLDGCPKAEGMMMLIRSMSPEVVAVDEIGTAEDLRALESVLNCGCRILATVHGNSMEDVRQKPLLGDLVERHVFQRYILLSGKETPGTLQAVFDGRGTRLYQKGVGSCCGAARCVSW